MTRVLDEALNADLILPFKRTPIPPNADQTRHCLYHRNFSHTTEECVVLKDKIEELVWGGYLRHFVRKEGKNRGSMMGENPEPTKRVTAQDHEHRNTRTIGGEELTVHPKELLTR